MRIVVCCKQVPDTSARLQVRDRSLQPHAPGILPVMNPYDEFALEEALGLQEGHEAEVVLVMLTWEPVEETLFHGLAMGADRSLVLEVPSDVRPDPLATGRILAPVIKALQPDLVFCGERAVDDDAAQVGPIVAEMLDLPQVCGVERVELDARLLQAHCRRGDAIEVYSCPLPCVATFVRGRQLPRYPSLDDIFGAGDKPQERRQVTSPGNVLRRLALEAPSEDRGGTVIAGASLGEAVDELLDRIEQATHIL